jgi:5-formyltetrahydrofolate cyclo-ligase
MRERRAALPAPERAQMVATANERLLALPELGAIAGRTVAGYVAVHGEIDPAGALAELAGRGATVVLPRVTPGDRQLRFAAVAADGALVPGAFGIPEPAASGRDLTGASVDVLIVPGLAFDAEGRRLGFGGGYYDTAFADVPAGERPTLIGLAYDFQIVARCPATELDVPVDVVVTDARVLRRDGAGREGRA